MPDLRQLINELRDEYTFTRMQLNQLWREGKKTSKEYKQLQKHYEELGSKFNELFALEDK